MASTITQYAITGGRGVSPAATRSVIQYSWSQLWLVVLGATVSCPLVGVSILGIGTLPRLFVGLFGFTVIVSWLTSERMRLSYREFSFFAIALTIAASSALRSSTNVSQANFFFLSVLLFIATYTVTAHYSRRLYLSKVDLGNAVCWVGFFIALSGIIDWICALILGKSLFVGLLNISSEGGYISSVGLGALSVPRASGLFADPNMFAYTLILPTTLVAARVSASDGGYLSRQKLRDLLLYGFLFVAIILSMSRSGIIAALIAGSLFAILTKTARFSWWVWGASSLILLLAFSSMFFNLGLIENITQQRLDLTGGVVESIGDSRTLRMASGFDAFYASPLTGVGIGNVGLFLPDGLKHEEIVTTHSFYLDILAGSGIIGGSVLLLGICVFLRKCWGSAEGSEICNAAVVALFAVLLTQFVYRNLLSPAIAFQFAIVASMCRART